MMGSYSVLIFSLFLISSIILVSNFETSFADEITATSTSFEDSTILELKNNRGNIEGINSVRIWLGEDNEFKSFKTERNWMGKNTPQGVIIFTTQNELNPGESVKFGIKTIEKNPIIYWKTISKDGEKIITGSAKNKTTIIKNEELQLNKRESVGIKDDSTFRLIPENPTTNSDFRIVGENFVPGKTIEFYLQGEFKQTIKIDENGRIFSTSKTPDILNEERVEFILRDANGNEKINSIRILEIDNREIAELIRLTMGNTPKEVKLGDTVNVNGVGTPGATLIIESKDAKGRIVNSDLIQIKNNGKWNYEYLISPDLDIGKINLEVSDGKKKILRDFDVISSARINVFSEQTMYGLGDIVKFDGTGIAEQQVTISLEDPVGVEIYSRSFLVDETGNINFEVEISKNAMEGTYIMYLFQGNEEVITNFGVGQEPEPILILEPSKLNFKVSEDVSILIKGTPNAQIALTLIDSSDKELFSDSINLGADGREIYEIESGTLANGAYILDAQRSESTSEARFTVGFTTGSGKIEIQTTKNTYRISDQILILGNTESKNVILDIAISDSNGRIIKTYQTYSDKFGLFKIDNFKIPLDGEIGIWTINAKSGGNFKQTEFEVLPEKGVLEIVLEKTNYLQGEMMIISGHGASSSFIEIIIINSDEEDIQELLIPVNKNGQFTTIWQIPSELIIGEYEIEIDDGNNWKSEKFTVSSK